MKKLLSVFAVILCLAVSCQKYDDSQIKKDISDLQEQVASLKAWCESSQAAIDAVETLKKAVENFNGISYVEYFSGSLGSGYNIGLDDGQEITIYNVKQEGTDAYLGNVIINQSSIVFTLSDGTSFSLPRKDGQIHFASYDTVTVNLLDTMEVLLPEGFKKADFAAFTAKVESGDGVATKAGNEDGWKVTAIAPEFDGQGSLVKNPSVVFAGIPYERTSAVLTVSLVDNNGSKTSASKVIYSGTGGQKGGFAVRRLRDLGEVSPNPVGNLSNCLLPGSKETIESFRHVSKGRLYYMEYIAQFPFEEMIVRDPKLRYKPNQYQEMVYRLNTLLYEDAIMGGEAPHITSACSGFVCHNNEGQLLFGRNMDSGNGNLIVTFHGNQKSGYNFVLMTNQAYVDALNGITEPGGKADGVFMDGERLLSLALRQPLVSLDGMNEHGLCFAGYQLPSFDPEKAMDDPYMQMPVDQNTGKPQITFSTLHYLMLSKCKTVDDVKAMLDEYDYVTIWNAENVHWYVADATGKYAVIEYWGKGTAESPFKVYVMEDALSRYIDSGNTTYFGVPYEYNSIENYYCNPEAAANFNDDKWQINFASKARVFHMMSAYKPVMSEEEALWCLQEGTFAIEVPNDVTNWSCIYNPAERTMLFNMRNDMSEVYSIDLKKDLKIK